MISKNKNMSESDSRKYKRRRFCCYNKDWEQHYDWLRQVHDSPDDAICNICFTTFTIKWDGLKAIKKHLKSFNHLQCMQVNLPTFVVAAELANVYHENQHHHSNLSIDCSRKLHKQIYHDSAIAKKIAAERVSICQNILAPFSVQKIIEELGSNFFSISSDSSNKGNRKLFPLCIRYYNPSTGIQDRILEFYEDTDETPLQISKKITEILKKFNLNIKYISSYSVDNSAVNYGKHHSVYMHLKKKIPNLIAANCFCHVFNNAAKYAAKCLSMDVETLTIKIHNEFSGSAKNVETLKSFCEFVDLEWAQILSQVPTRWLSLYPAVCRIAEKWPALKAYFLSNGEENCDKLVWKFVAHYSNFEISSDNDISEAEIYLHFIHHVTGLFHEKVLLLENKSCTLPMLYQIIKGLIDQLNQRKKDEFYGFKAYSALRKLSESDATEIKCEFNEFYDRSIEYISRYFNAVTSPFKNLDILELKNDFEWSQLHLCVEDLKLIEYINLDDLYKEYAALKPILPDIIKKDLPAVEKWNFIFKKYNSPMLIKLMQFVYSIPVSNAYTERVFSIMDNIGTDQPNRLEQVKSELQVKLNFEMSCYEFYKYIKNKPTLLEAAKSNQNYIWENISDS